ncbi:hypothetical protein FRB97_000025 [Tulasnella sp. 331]|nr:hypothetical protein FRB97_000025 [Tulasnella sp. 331]
MSGDNSSSSPPPNFQPHWFIESASISHQFLPSAPSSSSVSHFAYDSKYYSQLPPTNASASASYDSFTTSGAAVPGSSSSYVPALQQPTHISPSNTYPPNSSAAHASLQSGGARGGGMARGAPASYSGDYPVQTSAHEALLDPYFTQTTANARHHHQAAQSYSQPRQQLDYEPESSSSYSDPQSHPGGGSGPNREDDMPITLPNVHDMLAQRPTSPLGPTRSPHTKAREQAVPYSRQLRKGKTSAMAKKVTRAASPLFHTHREHNALPSVEVPPSPEPSPEYSPPPPSGKQSSSKAPKKNKDGVLDKSFICQICQASFARNHDLTRHYTGHDKEKAHRCNGCDRSFTRKDALKRHSQTKDCGDAQNGEPTGWLKRKAVKKAREANNEHDPEEEEIVLSMPPPRPSAQAGASSAASTGRNHSVSSGSRHTGLFATRASIREASAPYPTSSVGSHPRDVSPISEVLGIHPTARSSMSRAARYSAHRTLEESTSTGVSPTALPGRGDPVSTPMHVRLPASVSLSDQHRHQLMTGRAAPQNGYPSIAAQAHRLRSSTYDAYTTGVAAAATTTAAPQEYADDYGNGYSADSTSTLSQWNNTPQHQYHSR